MGRFSDINEVFDDRLTARDAGRYRIKNEHTDRFNVYDWALIIGLVAMWSLLIVGILGTAFGWWLPV